MKINTGSTKESLIWNTIFPAGFQVFKFGFSILLARVLDPFDFGVVGIAGIIIFYSNSFSSLGLGNALIQRKEINQSHLNTFFTLNLSVSVCLVVVLCILAGKISSFYNITELRDVFVCLSTIFLMSSFYMIPMIQLKRNFMFKEIVKIDIIKGIFNVGLALSLALIGFHYWSIVIGQIVSNMIATVLIKRKVSWTPEYSFNKIAFNQLKSFALWNFIMVQVNLLAEQIDKLLIGKFLGPIHLGYYDKSFNIGNMPLLFISRKISSVIFATFSSHQKDKQHLAYYFSRVMVVNVIVSFPCYIGLLAVSDQFVLVLLGEKWSPMIHSFNFLLLAFALASVTTILENLILSCGYFGQLTKFKIGATFLLLAILALVARISIEAVGLTIIGYYGCLLSISLYIAQKILSFKWKRLIALLFPAVSASFFMYACISMAETVLFIEMKALDLLGLIFIGAFTYIVFLLVFNFKECRFVRSEIVAAIKKRSCW